MTVFQASRCFRQSTRISASGNTSSIREPCAGVRAKQATTSKNCTRRSVRCAAADPNKEIQDLLEEANRLLDQAANPPPPDAAAAEQLAYECDENGCVLVSRSRPGDSAKRPSPLSKLLSGDSWTLGTQRSLTETDGEYPAVVSGDGWSIPLTVGELSEFVQDLQRIKRVVHNLHSSGQWSDGTGGRPQSHVKWESGTVYMEATLEASEPQPLFSLEFRINSKQQRSVHASWPSDVVTQVLEALTAEIPDLELEVAPATALA